MTQVQITINDAEPAALAKILKTLGLDPKGPNVTVSAVGAPPGTNGDAWNPEVARMFVDGLRENAFKTLMMVCENGGVANMDDVMAALGLKGPHRGKALGGVMSSVGHNLRALAETGHLPEDTRVVERDEESREFRAVVPKRVLNLLYTACRRRQRFEEGRGVAVVGAA